MVPVTPEPDAREMRLWLRRLRRVIADTPTGARVMVASGFVRVMVGCDDDATHQEAERVRATVETCEAPGWREDDP